MKEAEMRLKSMFLVGLAMVAAGSLADTAGASTQPAVRISGAYTVDTTAQPKTDCKPISKRNPAVMTCEVSGFTLIYSGSLQGRGVSAFRWVIDCRSGKSYTDGTETFTGSVEGVGSGTFSWGVRSKGTFDCEKAEVTSISARQNLYSGTDALAGLYGTMHRGPATYAGVLGS
jgi:Protein of unknown function (DUF3224)